MSTSPRLTKSIRKYLKRNGQSHPRLFELLDFSEEDWNPGSMSIAYFWGYAYGFKNIVSAGKDFYFAHKDDRQKDIFLMGVDDGRGDIDAK
jgi:hypothetical protein